MVATVLHDNSTVSVGAAESRIGRIAGLFAACMLVISLILQRFAVPVGEAGVDLVFPVGFALAAMAFIRGALELHRGRLAIFLAFTLWLAIGAGWQAVHPNAYGAPYSVSSVLQFLLLTAVCTLSFVEPLDEMVFFRSASNILAVLAVAGIVQFMLQFVGVSLFAFTGLLPARLLFESGYNLSIPVGIGSLLKSNGFFLLEPSIFSQVMAMAIIIEVLTARRVLWLALFAAGLLLSFSGTGLIVLASFFIGVVIALGWRGLTLALGGLLSLVVIAVAVALLAPDVARVFAGRLGELSQPSSSGYLRFVTPIQLLHAVLTRDSWAWLLGIGAGTSEKMDLPFLVNTPVKITVEYGLPAFILYLALLLKAERTRVQTAMVLPALVLLMITGGYQEFAPVLFPIFILICVARLRPAVDLFPTAPQPPFEPRLQ